MLTEITAPLEEVAEALGIPAHTLKRRSRILHEKKGFPLPLPGSTWRWSRRAVTSWVEAAGGLSAPASESQAETAPDERLGAAIILEQHRALRERYGGAR